MLLQQAKFNLKDCTCRVSSDGLSQVTISQGTLKQSEGADLVLDDDVQYTFLTEQAEERVAFGYLVQVMATGALDVYVEEVYRDARILLHHWHKDKDLKCLHLLFQVEVYPAAEPRVVIWVPEEIQ